VAIFILTGAPILGWAVVAVIGTAHILALLWWAVAGRFWLAGKKLLPFHLATLAALAVHVHEEFTQDFAGAMRHTFHTATPTGATFVNAIVFAVPVLYLLAALGLWFEIPFAEFLTYTLLFGPGFMEWTHYIFPLIQGGRYHYFPGMWTAWLPMIPGISGLIWNWRRIRMQRNARPATN
jgi:hypothetical protein